MVAGQSLDYHQGSVFLHSHWRFKHLSAMQAGNDAPPDSVELPPLDSEAAEVQGWLMPYRCGSTRSGCNRMFTESWGKPQGRCAPDSFGQESCSNCHEL